MESPRPVPSGFVVKKGSKMDLTNSFDIPQPLSVISIPTNLFFKGYVLTSTTPSL